MKRRVFSTVFAPGIALTNRLSFARKFVALGFVALVAVCVTLYSLYVSLNQIVTSSRSELEGLVLMELHSRAIQLVQQHRGLYFSAKGGGAELETQRAAKEKEITAAYTTFQNRLLISARPPEIVLHTMADWDRIRTSGERSTPVDSFVAHTALIRDMLLMQTVLADDYGLTADPDLDAYYLAHISSTELLGALEQLGQMRAYGAGILGEKSATDNQLVHIGTLMTLLDDKLRALKTNIDKTARYNPALQEQLAAEYAVLEESAHRAVGIVNSEILTRRFATTQAEYLGVLTAIIDGGYARMYRALLPATHRLIDARIQRASNTLYTSAAIAALILVVVAYFMTAIYIATLGSVTALSQAAAAYAHGDMDVRVKLKTHDELVSIGESFNRMADELSKLMVARTDAAQHTQAILDNMVDALITIDELGIILSFNLAATRIFGYAVDEVLGKNVKMLMPSPHRDNHDSYMRNYQTTRTARIIGIGREVEGQRKDGSLFPMDLAISEVRYQGRPMYVGLARDITERKRTDRLKAEFVSTVSHELRTPLTAISGALGLMSGGAVCEMPTQIRQLVDVANRNSHRLGQLINDLLDMEKLVAGKMHFESRRQSLLPLLEQAIEGCRHYGSDRRVTVVLLSALFRDVTVLVDGQRLIQALANLLSNAIKYSPEGGTVDVTLQLIHDTARVIIADCGPGVPAEFYSRIFQKFSQADSSDTRQKGGTGLGLAITRELVERMGGRIGFDSVEGHGAKFYIDLPLSHDDELSRSVA